MSDSSDSLVQRLTPLQEATLPALEALDRFYQRHKNQHRVARWWAQLGILRRSLRRLLHALDSYQEHSALSRKAPIPRKRPSSRSTATELHFWDATVEQARWVNDRVLPQAYLAFTQLAADQQHAPLGLFLIGLVGLLSNALAPMFASSQSALSRPASVGRSQAAQPAREDALTWTDGPELDLGVTIPRADVEPAPRSFPESPSATEAESSRGGDGVPFGRELNTTTPGEPQPSEVAAMKKSQKRTLPPDAKPTDSKRKKKRRKEDEFANLFGSLL